MSKIIGISGGSGSGKTSFIRDIRKKFSSDEVCVLSQDDYYKPREQQIRDLNGVQNFDLPTSIDLEAFISDIDRLIHGEAVTRMEYTFNNDKAESKTLTFNPAPVIIVEGLFIFHERRIMDKLDLSIIIQAKDSDKIIRRIIRDQKERNYPIDDVLYRYKNHVVPSYERYIYPYLDDVDLIVNNNHNYDGGLAVVVSYIEKIQQVVAL